MLEDDNASNWTTRNLEPGTRNSNPKPGTCDQLPASCFPLKSINQCYAFLVSQLKRKNIEPFQMFIVPFVLVSKVNQFG